MPKRTSPLTLTLPPRRQGEPAYRWLCGALRVEILEGRLRAGARMPATRELARRYGLARGTIVMAFEELKAQGYVTSRSGSGTYVNQSLPDTLFETRAQPRGEPAAAPRAPRRLSLFGKGVALLAGPDGGPARAFRANQPALDLFPTALWAQIASRRLRRASASLLQGCEAMGYLPLREAVAEYVQTSRGARCTAGQVAIVAGVQDALDLVARVLLDRGDRVCMENPGYSGAAGVFAAYGATISSVRLDDEGMVVPGDELRDAKLAYVTPAHQFPVGIAMSLPRRLALLAWAHSCGALIFEDDYDGEYRYRGSPIPALQGLDRHGLVLFVGSFSKVLFPSLRLGYLVLPPDLVDCFAATISVTHRHAAVPEQAVLCDFIAEGHFGRHLRRMREIYAERLEVLLACARETLGGMLEISGVEAGLQTAGWLRGGLRAAAVTQAAALRYVEVVPLDRYTRGRTRGEALQLGFAAIEPREIRRGARDLAAVLEAELKRPT